MKTSLQTRVSFFITLTIVFVSAFSTYLFTTAHDRTEKNGLVVRGNALSFALSKAAEEGLLKEDLNLIKKASYLIKAPDVTLAQVYSDIWEPLDAYPVGGMAIAPSPEAVAHFHGQTTPFHIENGDNYDFYHPIYFRAFEDSRPTVIGYVRVVLSAAAIEGDLRRIAVANFTAAALITLVAVFLLNFLMRRYAVQPLMALYRSVTQFKDGKPVDAVPVVQGAANEIRGLAGEFNRMITTVKEKEDRLVESEQRIRSLFDRVEHAIFRIDPEGVISEANQRFRTLFGDVTGLCDILISDLSAADCLRTAAAKKSLHIDAKAVAANGDELMIALSLYPEHDGSGLVRGFDGYILDLTETKRLEERLIRSQKLEAIGTLAAGMAHDFNNLMTAILGYSGIMLQTAKEGDPFFKPATVINEAAKRGAELGKKILTATRKDRMTPRAVNVNALIVHSLDLLRETLPKNIEIKTNLQDDLPETSADPSQLQQVLINLAVNARDAMPDGGRLTVETSLTDPGSDGTGKGRAGAPGFIKLTVSDTGTGIDSATQARIFDPFFTTKDTGKGTGLGLYIVHSIISNHGGYINVYSEPRQGTRFNLYLPLLQGAASPALQESADIMGRETILIIDDEVNVRYLCQDMLVPLGYTVLLAENGMDGINLYRARQRDISLIILDMVMPTMEGNEVFHALRTINPGVKVLLYSGYSDHNFAGIRQLLDQGAAGFIQKPFSPREIGIAVRKALA